MDLITLESEACKVAESVCAAVGTNMEVLELSKKLVKGVVGSNFSGVRVSSVAAACVVLAGEILGFRISARLIEKVSEIDVRNVRVGVDVVCRVLLGFGVSDGVVSLKKLKEVIKG